MPVFEPKVEGSECHNDASTTIDDICVEVDKYPSARPKRWMYLSGSFFDPTLFVAMTHSHGLPLSFDLSAGVNSPVHLSTVQNGWIPLIYAHLKG